MNKKMGECCNAVGGGDASTHRFNISKIPTVLTFLPWHDTGTNLTYHHEMGLE